MLLPVLLACVVLGSPSSAKESARTQVVTIVAQIQRADYEGDRAALKRLHEQLAPSAKNQELASRVLYWQGFALWRRAINGFNDKVDAAELQGDLQTALDEFDEATRIDHAFVDAKVGALSCAGLLAYSTRHEDTPSAKTTEQRARTRALWTELQVEAPDNPRFLWVEGPILWNVPPQYGGGQPKAIETYEKGLTLIRAQKAAGNSLDPSWGEPELFMSLAWSKLNQITPETNAAEQDADSALKLIPYWHYVRDILLPQIREAKQKAVLDNATALHL
jgi:tetratricopeptide (TPR) repeat protein